MGAVAVQCRVEGRVQGVGFRYWTERTARQHGLKGWVRNRPDGSVEVLMQGPDDAVSAMLAWLDEGPPYATVSTVHTKAISVDPDLADFEVRF